MQNSELFRRGVVLPLDQSAEDSLRTNNVDTTTRVFVLRIQSDSLFEDLWRTGVFDKINERCGTLIDDYEEEFVEADRIKGLIAAVRIKIEDAFGADPDVQSFIAEVLVLAENASKINRPVLFVL